MISVSEGTRRALMMTTAGLVLGILAEILLHGARPGVNVLLWVLAAMGLIAGFARRQGPALDRQVRWLAVPALFFAGAAALRDAPSAVALSLLMLGVTALTAVTAAQGGRLAAAGLLEYGLRLLYAAAAVVTGPFRLIGRDVAWNEVPRGETYRTVLAVARGLIIALPLLLIFGALLTSADLVFARLVEDVFDLNLPAAIDRLLFTAFWAWLATGLLRGLTRAEAQEVPAPPQVGWLSVGTVEAATVLGAVNTLFLAFVIVQLRYLFGGAALVEETLGLTYADDARRGFFELTAAAALVVPLLLGADRLVRPPAPRQRRILHGLAATLVALVYVTLASAVYRMVLYQQAYGLTEMRLLVMFFLGWLAFVLAWLLATTLTGRRERFVVGVLAAAYVTAALLVAVNPHAVIARANLAHYEATGRFDADYAATLSADAAPVLIRALPYLPEPDRAHLAAVLLDRWPAQHPAGADWRSWNLGRQQAAAAVTDHRAELEEAAGRRP
ncbi:MAG TPA: DUF4173 domain-containing protein [Bacillota bacterium]